jgi:pimeloyl-ACP methyl ester carboxylesterase
MSVYIIPGFFSKKIHYQKLASKLREVGLAVEIVDLGMNVRDLNYSAQKVLGIFEISNEKIDIIAHSYGGLIFKQLLLNNPDIGKRIKSVSFVAVPHHGSWAALLVPILPAARNMIPFSEKLKKNAEVVLPDNTTNFLPEKEIKIWPKKSSRLEGVAEVVIPCTDHDSIINNEDFFQKVVEFIKTNTAK